MERRKDLTENRYGKLTAKYRIDEPGPSKWTCLCDCGVEVVKDASYLEQGRIYSCGCEKRPQPNGKNHHSYIDIPIGSVFTDWTVLSEGGRDRFGSVTWTCLCVCGTRKNVSGINLRKGASVSCGCHHSAQRRRAAVDRYELSGKRTGGFRHMYRTYQRNAKRRKLVWEITEEDFAILTQGDCSFCGTPPSHFFGRRTLYPYLANGIDRTDNSIGYVKSNVTPCCSLCNIMKMHYTVEEFFQRVRTIYERHIQPQSFKAEEHV